MILQASLRTQTAFVCIRDRDIAMQLTQTTLGLKEVTRERSPPVLSYVQTTQSAKPEIPLPVFIICILHIDVFRNVV